MKFRDILNENLTEAPSMKYTVYDEVEKKVIKPNLTKAAAEKLCAKNPNYKMGSSAWVHDKLNEAKTTLPRKIKNGDTIDIPDQDGVTNAKVKINDIYISTGLRNDHRAYINATLSWKDKDGKTQSDPINIAFDNFVSTYFS